MTARLADRLPQGDAWLYEVKLDGYRALLLKDDDDVRIRSRNDKDLTVAYPSVMQWLKPALVAQVRLSSGRPTAISGMPLYWACGRTKPRRFGGKRRDFLSSRLHRRIVAGMVTGRRLTRSNNKMIGGVCAGLADYLGVNVTMFRIAFVVVSVISAAFPGIIVYVVLWALMPRPEVL